MPRQTKLATAAAIAAFLFSTSAFANKADYFNQMDANGDGRITSLEHEAASTEKFTKADANSDGMLTKGELAGFMIDEKGKSGSKASKKSNKKMAMYDANSDGQLTQQEYQAGHKEHFGKMDANADGSVTMEEMEMAKKNKM